MAEKDTVNEANPQDLSSINVSSRHCMTNSADLCNCNLVSSQEILPSLRLQITTRSATYSLPCIQLVQTVWTRWGWLILNLKVFLDAIAVLTINILYTPLYEPVTTGNTGNIGIAHNQLTKVSPRHKQRPSTLWKLENRSKEKKHYLFRWTSSIVIRKFMGRKRPQQKN